MAAAGRSGDEGLCHPWRQRIFTVPVRSGRSPQEAIVDHRRKHGCQQQPEDDGICGAGIRIDEHPEIGIDESDEPRGAQRIAEPPRPVAVVEPLHRDRRGRNERQHAPRRICKARRSERHRRRAEQSGVQVRFDRNADSHDDQEADPELLAADPAVERREEREKRKEHVQPSRCLRQNFARRLHLLDRRGCSTRHADLPDGCPPRARTPYACFLIGVSLRCAIAMTMQRGRASLFRHCLRHRQAGADTNGGL